MTNKELIFLDFILPILKDKYPDYFSVSDLNSMYKNQTGIDFGYRELSMFVDKYENIYFEKVSKMRHLRILTDWIDILDNYDTLSKYLDFEDQKMKKEDEKQKEIESLDKKVRELTIKNLELQNRKLKREILFGIIGFFIAALITNWKDILILLKVLPPD
jgi:hypothetical protein